MILGSVVFEEDVLRLFPWDLCSVGSCFFIDLSLEVDVSKLPVESGCLEWRSFYCVLSIVSNWRFWSLDER